MANRADIKAGGAFIDLFVKNNIAKGLSAGMASVRNGALALAGLGAAILAPLAAATAHFTKVGGDLHDMSQRTGLAARRLAFFKYAADQTGTSIEEIEQAIRFAQKQGFSAENFERLGQEIAAIEDPTRRAARNMEVFGKSASKLLPLFAELKELRERWKQLGIEPSAESVKLADELGDAWGDLKALAEGLAYEVGAALAPAAKELVTFLVPVVREIGKWVKENPQAVTALAALGAALFVVGSTVATIAATLAPVVALLTAILAGGEVAAIVGTLIFLTAIWYSLLIVIAKTSGAWDAAVKLMKRTLGPLLALVKKTFKGIADAIKTGDMEKAWEIALAGMTVLWHQFTKQIFDGLVKINEGLSKFFTVFGGLLGLATGPLDAGIGEALKEFSRGAGLDAELAMKKLEGLNTQAAAKARAGQGQGGRPQDYPLPMAGASVIGANAFAALQSRQIIGGGRNIVNDTLNKILKLDERELMVLEAIGKHVARRPRVGR